MGAAAANFIDFVGFTPADAAALARVQPQHERAGALNAGVQNHSPLTGHALNGYATLADTPLTVAASAGSARISG